jgi:histidyl-tRNA synthetase
VLDCKNQTCQELLQESPKLINNLCQECDSDFSKLTTLLDKSGIDYSVDTNLVRGLDYYSKTAFEFVSNQIGAQSAIAGGGRYDRLVEFLDGKPTPAVGFAIGIERIMELAILPDESKNGYYIGAMCEEAIESIVHLANRLRASHKVTLDYNSKGFKSHMKGVDKANAKYAILIGEDELKNGTLWIKDIESKEEQTIPMDSLNITA